MNFSSLEEKDKNELKGMFKDLEYGMDSKLKTKNIEFRGKSLLSENELNDKWIEHDNGWVVGNLIKDENDLYIVGRFVDVTDQYTNLEWWVKIHECSLGIFTGSYDDKGKKVFEGDIVKYKKRNLQNAFDKDEEPFKEGLEIIRKNNLGIFTIPKGFVQNIDVIGNSFDMYKDVKEYL